MLKQSQDYARNEKSTAILRCSNLTARFTKLINSTEPT